MLAAVQQMAGLQEPALQSVLLCSFAAETAACTPGCIESYKGISRYSMPGPSLATMHSAPLILRLDLVLLLLLLPGHMHGINTASQPGEPDDLAVAEAIAGGCYQMYRQSPSGV